MNNPLTLNANTRAFLEQIIKDNEKAMKKIFKDEIRASLLIEIKNRVVTLIDHKLPEIYDFNYSSERILTGNDNYIDYDICRMIVGVHHSNMVFLSKEEKSAKGKDPAYKEQLARQVADLMLLRGYGVWFFRTRPVMGGERFIFYPVPYLLFVFCTRANQMHIESAAKTDSRYWEHMIIGKAVAALTLLEDQFLDTAYMPCRTMIEAFAKLLLFRKHPALFAEANRFAIYDLEKTCCSQEYTDEFNDAFSKRKCIKASKLDYLHYGFVDAIKDYHNIVKKKPYSIGGILQYLAYGADAETVELCKTMKTFYTMCHGYVHGNGPVAKYKLLNYFEISLIIGNIIPRIYRMVCEETGNDTSINGIDVLKRFEEEFALLKKQYAEKSTEKFEEESC